MRRLLISDAGIKSSNTGLKTVNLFVDANKEIHILNITQFRNLKFTLSVWSMGMRSHPSTLSLRDITWFFRWIKSNLIPVLLDTVLPAEYHCGSRNLGIEKLFV